MIRILFVDDEPSVLSGLRRMFYAMRDHWDMQFAEGGTAGLETLDKEPVDVVVSDMRMPIMDGAAFLAHVRDRYPQTARIVLSGYSDSSLSMRSVPVAHQFLSKPCEPDRLREAVERSYAVSQRLGSPEVQELVGKLGSLPTPSTTIIQLNAALGRPDSTFSDVAEVVRSDPSLTAKLLQLVNSAFFGVAKSVSDINEAISYLGLSTVRNLMIATELITEVDDPSKSQVLQAIHAHSLEVARKAKELATLPEDKEEAFVAGLLHEIGTIVLTTRATELDDPLADRMHGEIGASLLELWGVPHRITNAVLCHHDHVADDLEHIGVREAVALAELSTAPYSASG